MLIFHQQEVTEETVGKSGAAASGEADCTRIDLWIVTGWVSRQWMVRLLSSKFPSCLYAFGKDIKNIFSNYKYTHYFGLINVSQEAPKVIFESKHHSRQDSNITE